MAQLRLQYTIGDFDAWRKLFDADPLDRAGSGVRRVLVTRGVDAPDLLFVDLEFETVEEARTMLGRFEELWAAIPGDLAPQASGTIVETVLTEEH